MRLGEVEYLERRRKALQDEIAKARLQNPPAELLIADLKRRTLHLAGEIERFHQIHQKSSLRSERRTAAC